MIQLNVYEKIKLKDEERFIVVGDIHGDYKGLKEVLKQNGITPDTRIFGVGDIVDRGKNIAACLNEFLYNDHYHMVVGNHELMMIDAIDKHEKLHWQYNNGGEQTLDELGDAGFLHYRNEIIKTFPYILEIEHRGKKFGIVHAGIPVGRQPDDPNYPNNWTDIIQLAKNDEYYRRDLVWDRDVILNVYKGLGNLIPPVQGIDYVIHGHTGVEQPLIHENRIWIDTNFSSQTLTLAEFNHDTNSWDFHQLYYD